MYCSSDSTPSATTVMHEAVGEGDDRVHDEAAVGVAVEVGDEHPVDLHDVDREPLEIAERRVAGSEVVEREHHAELLELVERDERPFAVSEEHALGHLERDHVRIGVRVGEHRRDRRGEVGRHELVRGDVHRDLEPVGVVGSQASAGGRGTRAPAPSGRSR